MEALESIQARIEAGIPGVRLTLHREGGPTTDASLGVDAGHALATARFLRDDPALRLDYASNVTGVDWPEKVWKEKAFTRRVVEGVERTFEETVERRRPGYLEAVYHLYSVALKHGPLVLRMRTGNRTDQVELPSLTPVWRACEFQEREVYDLFGIVFAGHPDLRRILMWDEFVDHPMRKDYVEPDDYEYEPTPHDAVLQKVKARAAREVDR